MLIFDQKNDAVRNRYIGYNRQPVQWNWRVLSLDQLIENIKKRHICHVISKLTDSMGCAVSKPNETRRFPYDDDVYASQRACALGFVDRSHTSMNRERVLYQDTK